MAIQFAKEQAARLIHQTMLTQPRFSSISIADAAGIHNRQTVRRTLNLALARGWIALASKEGRHTYYRVCTEGYPALVYLAGGGVPAWRIMPWLAKTGGRWQSLTSIIQATGYGRHLATKYVLLLEAEGYIETKLVQAKKIRSRMARLTGKGRALVRRAQASSKTTSAQG